MSSTTISSSQSAPLDPGPLDRGPLDSGPQPGLERWLAPTDLERRLEAHLLIARRIPGPDRAA